ncbi:MAG TPA: GNAT family N-acetyltransferase [Verrucomicrobiae bacterium]
MGAERIFDLRHRILRAGLPPESARFDGDGDEATLHLAAFAVDAAGRSVGQPAACLSMMLNTFQSEPAWQLRGMAVDDPHQNRGLGGVLLARGEEIVTAAGKAGLIWCNARVPAARFYQKQGWAIVSEPFEVPTAGPHVKMSKRLNLAFQRESVEKPRG